MDHKHKSTGQGINWDLLLTTLFYVFAGASVLSFVALRSSMPWLFMALGCVAVALRIAYYIQKFIPRR